MIYILRSTPRCRQRRRRRKPEVILEGRALSLLGLFGSESDLGRDFELKKKTVFADDQVHIVFPPLWNDFEIGLGRLATTQTSV